MSAVINKELGMHYEIFYYGKVAALGMAQLPLLDKAGAPFTHCSIAGERSAAEAYALALERLIATLPHFTAVQEASAVLPQSWSAMDLLNGRISVDDFDAGYRVYIGIACRVD